MKQNDLMIIRTTTKEVILSEIVETDDRLAYVLINPFIITITDKETSAQPFIPGTDQNNFIISKDFVVTMARPDEFISRFYGTIIYRELVQSLLANDQCNGTPLAINNYIETKLFVEKHEILTKFGMIGESQYPQKGEQH